MEKKVEEMLPKAKDPAFMKTEESIKRQKEEKAFKMEESKKEEKINGEFGETWEQRQDKEKAQAAAEKKLKEDLERYSSKKSMLSASLQKSMKIKYLEAAKEELAQQKADSALNKTWTEEDFKADKARYANGKKGR